MQHERLAAFAVERVDELCVATGAERGDHERLGLATREQRRAMRTRQHTDLDGDRTDGGRVAPIDARLTGEDALADDVALELVELVIDLVGGELRCLTGAQLLDDALLDLADTGIPGLLLDDAVGIGERTVRRSRHGRLELRSRGALLPVPARLAAFLDELVDGVDHHLHLLVAEDHGAEHHVFGEAVGLGFHHHHAVLGAGDDEVQIRFLELLGGRVEQILTVRVADTGGADGAIEGCARQGEGRRGADHRRDIGVDLGIERDDRRDDLHFMVEAVREERTDRTVDEARGERLLFGRPAFALEESARDATRSVGLLLVVDREREEVPARGGFFGGDRGAEHDGVAELDHHCGAGLAGHLAGLDAEGVGAVLE